MSRITEEIDLGNGRRLVVYDDGGQQWIEGARVVYMEAPQSRDREIQDRRTGTRDRGTGTGEGSAVSPVRTPAVHGSSAPASPARRAGGSELLQSFRSVAGPESVDPARPEDLEWLRQQIVTGHFTRESRPLSSVPVDQYLVVINHDRWAYLIGRQHRTMYALPIVASMADTPVFGRDKYLWGPRGSGAARAAWQRDYARTHPLGSLLTSRETETALADSGIAPAAALLSPQGDFSLSDLPRALMLISRAAIDADEQIGSYFQDFVARYNGDGVAGSIVAVLAGAVEFVVRFIVGIVAIPAAIETLITEVRNIMQAIQQALPDILAALQEAPLETSQYLLQISLTALSEVTGLAGIAHQGATALEAAGEGRDAESSLHIIRATTRILELLLIVRGLISGLRRLPTIARNLRNQLAAINRVLPRLRAVRDAARRARTPALPERRGHGERGSHPYRSSSPEGSSHPERSRHGPDSDSEAGRADADADSGEQGSRDSDTSSATTLPPGFDQIHEVMRRLLNAAQEGAEIIAGDFQLAQRLRELLQSFRRRGAIPEALRASFMEMERQIDVIEGVSHRRNLAASGARIFMEGGTPSALMIGEAGEEIARRILLSRGYRNVMAVINRSNNGIDLIGIDRFGSLRIFEIKASRTGRAPRLSAAQHNVSAFARSRLEQIASRHGTYATASDSTVAMARTLLAQLQRQSYVGGAVFDITHVFDLSRIRIRVRAWHGSTRPRSASWWARLFRRMGLETP